MIENSLIQAFFFRSEAIDGSLSKIYVSERVYRNNHIITLQKTLVSGSPIKGKYKYKRTFKLNGHKLYFVSEYMSFRMSSFRQMVEYLASETITKKRLDFETKIIVSSNSNTL